MRVLVAFHSDSSRALYWSCTRNVSYHLGPVICNFWVSGCELCEHLLAVNSCRCRCRMQLGDHQEMHWYPLEKYHTQIPKNAKNTQYSDFVNNLIDISTRVGGTSM